MAPGTSGNPPSPSSHPACSHLPTPVGEAIDAEPVNTPDISDAFAAYVAAATAEGPVNPYPLYARYRRDGEVFRGNLGDAMTTLTGQRRLSRRPKDRFVVFTEPDAKRVLRDADAFSSRCMGELLPATFGRTLVAMDQPEHHTYRTLVAQAFTPRTLAMWRTSFIEPLVERLIDGFAHRGHAELVRELSFPFPVQVIAAMLGLPAEQLPRFQRLAIELFDIVSDWDRSVAAAEQLNQDLFALVKERRADGATSDDIISDLCRARTGDRTLSDEEIVDFCRLLLPAGAETTFRATNNLMFGLLTHPEQLAAIQADNALVPAAVEEALRWEPPFTTVMRTARDDVVVGGTVVPGNSVVLASIGSANHDDGRWPQPEQFDIFRERRSHLAFGTGPHMCLGIHLGQLELRALLTAVVRRLPGLRLDPASPPPAIHGVFGRSPLTLPVLFDT